MRRVLKQPVQLAPRIRTPFVALFHSTATLQEIPMYRIRTFQNVFLRLQIHWSLAMLAIVLGFFTCTAATIFAQTSADGTIHGRVTDNSGASLVGVNILAHSPAVGGTFKAVSDEEGNYRLIELPPGTDYVVEAEISGFEKFVRTGLVVHAGL